MADNDPQANPRGVAMRFALPDRTSLDLVGHSVDGFPARTPKEFLRFLKVLNNRHLNPTAFQQHVNRHPAARRFLGLPIGTPRSFVAEAYFMLHAFRLTGPGGSSVVRRLRLEPPGGTEHLSDSEAASRGPDFLHKDIETRLNAGPLEMMLILQQADPTDLTRDISTSWPEDRPLRMASYVDLIRVRMHQECPYWAE